MMTNQKSTANKRTENTAAEKTRIFMISLFTALSLAILIGLSFQAVPASATRSEAAKEQVSEKAIAEVNKKAAGTIREGDHIKLNGIVKEEPKKCEEGYLLVTVLTSDGRVFVLVMDSESTVKKGDTIKADCEVAGFTTTSEGLRVPLLENEEF